MESITVYQKIPHPGIQVNLNSYYSKQVGGACRGSLRWGAGGVGGRHLSGGGLGTRGPNPVHRPTIPSCMTSQGSISVSVKWEQIPPVRFLEG